MQRRRWRRLAGGGEHRGDLGQFPRGRGRDGPQVLGPGYVLDDDAEAWVDVVETDGELRVASSFVPLQEAQRLLQRGHLAATVP